MIRIDRIVGVFSKEQAKQIIDVVKGLNSVEAVRSDRVSYPVSGRVKAYLKAISASSISVPSRERHRRRSAQVRC